MYLACGDGLQQNTLNTGAMKEFPEALALFLGFVEQFNGLPPTFQLDYAKKEIILVEAPSAFLRELAVSGAVCSLRNGVVKVEFFA